MPFETVRISVLHGKVSRGTALGRDVSEKARGLAKQIQEHGCQAIGNAGKNTVSAHFIFDPPLVMY